MIRLEVMAGPHLGQNVETDADRILIGRSSKCHLVLKDDEHVSRYHGEVYRSGASVKYRDQSKTGSTIESNGSKTQLGVLLSKWKLKPNDRIRVGKSVIKVQWTEVQSPSDMDSDPSHSSESPTLFIDPIELDSANKNEFFVLEQFLRIRTTDLTDGRSARSELGRAFLDVFPRVEHAALISLRKPIKKRVLSPEDIDVDGSVFVHRGDSSQSEGYSFTVLERTCRSGKAVIFKRSEASLPSTKSVSHLGMANCLCVPLWDRDEIIGFVQLHESKGFSSDFTKRDSDLFDLLASISSLVLRQVKSAEDVAKAQRMASVGQAVAALSHDATSVLDSLGKFAGGLESDFPALKSNERWDYLRQDLDLMQFLIKHARTRMRGEESLNYSSFEVAKWVDRIAEACVRYFVDNVDQGKVCIHNLCAPNLSIYSDPDAISIAFLNCVKNAIDGFFSSDRDSRPAQCGISISAFDANDAPEDYFLFNIADTAGGIPEHVTSRMGRELITTKGEKGTGLGFQIVVDTIGLLRGEVIIASSINPTKRLPAGTIISFKLPKHTAAKSLGSRKSPVIKIEDYEQHFDYIYE